MATVSYNRQLRANLAIIFGLAQTLAISSGFGRSRIRRNCGYTLLPIVLIFLEFEQIRTFFNSANLLKFRLFFFGRVKVRCNFFVMFSFPIFRIFLSNSAQQFSQVLSQKFCVILSNSAFTFHVLKFHFCFQNSDSANLLRHYWQRSGYGQLRKNPQDILRKEPKIVKVRDFSAGKIRSN